MFWKWVLDFQPEVIFSTGGSIRLINLTIRLAQRTRVPIIADFRDDYPNAMYRESRLVAFPRRILMRQLGRLLAVSPVITSGSDPLGNLYGGQYGIPSITFIPSVPHAELQYEPVAPTTLTKKPLRFVYVGGLHLNRWKQLIEIGAILSKTQAQLMGGELVIYAPEDHFHQHRAELQGQPGIRLAGSLRQEEVFQELRNSDVLVHVESFDPIIQRFTWLSVSTKIPQYMAAGRPILAYGPAELASMQHIEETACGLVVGSRDPKALQAVVRQLMRDPILRARLGRQGWEAARDRHDADDAKDRFRRLVCKIAASSCLPPVSCMP
jgi:glycosyltransferase involved in cell wall biosynthesis